VIIFKFKKTKMAKIEEKKQVSVRDVLKGFISDSFLPSSGMEAFEDGDSFMEKGILDSTGVLELLEFIEEKFDIRVDDEEIIPDNLDSLNKLASFIQKKKENAS
jgi:acyl carrier protein